MASIKEVVSRCGNHELLTPGLWNGGEQKRRIQMALMIRNKDCGPAEDIDSISVSNLWPACSQGNCAAYGFERSSTGGLSEGRTRPLGVIKIAKLAGLGYWFNSARGSSSGIRETQPAHPVQRIGNLNLHVTALFM